MTRTWRTSSYSGGGDQNCVEVAFGGHVGVRDSKNPVPELAFTLEAWRGFLRCSPRVPLVVSDHLRATTGEPAGPARGLR
ncbi:DUF397 domain-containing protein [Umezawaea beigongshangensis]|uniref:DUF397 domain-containing protein n=1 Tax=Umezawaea beigongshangensis TaxID=2780383 RepID=UPI0018F1D350|nr:DUF397 domain-containing protein [Umezawaea beigongshangensis]